MTNVLAIDCSADEAVVCAVKDGVFAERRSGKDKRHNGVLLGLADEVLTQLGARPSDFDAFGAVVGPGSFTGIRIGVASVKALCLATDKPAVAIDALELLAMGEGDCYAAIDARNGNYYAAWRAMERLYKEGRVRAIGVTSFSNERLQDLFLHNEVKPAVNQLETHPFFQQQAANEFLQKEGIQHEAWAPFAEGKNDIFNHPTLRAIAERHGKGVGAVILRWLNQRNVVVIPKSVHKERMVENFNIFDFTLSGDEMAAIAALETGKSPIYDDMDVETVKGIGLHKIHD